MTARETMLPEAAGRAGWTLDHANRVYEAVFNLAYIVGPGIGGLLITTLGGVNTMLVTAGAFVLSIIAIACCAWRARGRPTRRRCPRGLGGHGRGPVVRVEQEGVAHARVHRPGRHRPVHANGIVLFPKYFTDRNEPAQLGWVLMALWVGGLIGALGYAVMSKYISGRTVMLIAVLTLGRGHDVIAFLPPLP